MKINEIFYSIQGEGKWAGLPNTFIRTTGCNLRCIYCDTKYAYENGEEMSIKEITKHITRYPCKHVCITGGEPLIQAETIDLVKNLLRNDYKICIETNGSINIEKIPGNKEIMISLDIKCPSSNMEDKMIPENITFLREKDQLKIIIKDKEDYDYAKKIIHKYHPSCDVFFQPVWGTNPKHLAEWIACDGLNVRLGLQNHKIIWGEKRGV